MFDNKCKEVLDNPACQISSAADLTNSSCRQQNFVFVLEILDIFDSEINAGLVLESVSSSHLKLSCPVFESYDELFMIKCLIPIFNVLCSRER